MYVAHRTRKRFIVSHCRLLMSERTAAVVGRVLSNKLSYNRHGRPVKSSVVCQLIYVILQYVQKSNIMRTLYKLRC